ncbi:MAG: hypothetical protein UV73_C0013G0018 [Candidatus Gottesmanbacteria bacterium GW2011_GWA2_43_14]|uniref:Uncharacterized protein n=1 Tax=Candidatus Gottesmanbacteria bacterium GW2011_GWA2_43_14 TaxID=1618443 RepID=A0A0G1GA90_9BACT|nr:MAG: hypothetical protein UV73_C0013G0018 [Candidatus Gottesmanbacteria bacterium GW2011_GWA2_43_14]
MPKNTLFLIIFLSVVATLLLGINIGKQMGVRQFLAQNQEPLPSPQISLPTLTETPPPSPTQTFTENDKIEIGLSQSVFTDRACGFSLAFTSTYLKQQTINGTSTIITEADNPESGIVATCQEEIPRPPLIAEKVEDIVLDGVPTKLYHDASSKDGTPRDEVIVRHPTKSWDIIVAGYGPTFDEAVVNFKFLR